MSKLQIVAGSFAVLMGLVVAPGCAPESPEYEGEDETAQQDDAVKGSRPPKKKCKDPARSYVETSPEQCQLVRVTCVAGQEFFSDDCGCGCVAVSTPCGSATCTSGDVCCNESCGICTAPGDFCTQQFCEG